MNLKSITTLSCPICGCINVEYEGVKLDSEHKIWTHCNGEQREYRAFVCGHKVEYNPNFRREEVVGKCRNDENLKRQTAQRGIVKMSVLSFIDELDCDDKFKERLTEGVKSVWID